MKAKNNRMLTILRTLILFPLLIGTLISCEVDLEQIKISQDPLYNAPLLYRSIPDLNSFDLIYLGRVKKNIRIKSFNFHHWDNYIKTSKRFDLNILDLKTYVNYLDTIDVQINLNRDSTSNSSKLVELKFLPLILHNVGRDTMQLGYFGKLDLRFEGKKHDSEWQRKSDFGFYSTSFRSCILPPHQMAILPIRINYLKEFDKLRVRYKENILQEIDLN